MSLSKRPILRELKWQNATFVQLFTQIDPTQDQWWQALENAYHNYPDEYFDKIRERLEGTTGYSMGAIWELYLWQLLTESGCQVQIEQPIPNTDKSADFYVNTEHGFAAYIEATTKSLGPGEEDVKRFYDELFYKVDKQIDVPLTLLSVATLAESATLPDPSKICQQIFDWVDSEHHEVVVDEPISLKLETDEGWAFKVQLFRNESESGHKLFLRLSGIIDDTENTREGLNRKIKKLNGDPGAPYIVAIALSSTFDISTTFDQFSALYGVPAINIEKITGATSDTFTNIWKQHQSQTYLNYVSGILIGGGSVPGFTRIPPPDLWLNPHAKHPIDPCLVPLDCVIHCFDDKGLMETRSGPGNTWTPTEII